MGFSIAKSRALIDHEHTVRILFTIFNHVYAALPWQKEPSDIFVKIELCIGGDSFYQDAHKNQSSNFF